MAAALGGLAAAALVGLLGAGCSAAPTDPALPTVPATSAAADLPALRADLGQPLADNGVTFTAVAERAGAAAADRQATVRVRVTATTPVPAGARLSDWTLELRQAGVPPVLVQSSTPGEDRVPSGAPWVYDFFWVLPVSGLDQPIEVRFTPAPQSALVLSWSGLVSRSGAG